MIRKRAVLVHCDSGISLSPTIILAFLMKNKGINLSSAIKLLENKTSEQKINPNNSLMY